MSQVEDTRVECARKTHLAKVCVCVYVVVVVCCA